MPGASSGAARGSTEPRQDARAVRARRAAQASSTTKDKGADLIQLVEEHIDVAKRRTLTGTVRVSTTTESVEGIAEADLDRYRVEVTRVPVSLVVDVAPVARVEGDTTVIPVIEERLVLVKQLFLVKEVRVRHVLERNTVREPVTLRRQHAVVERLALGGVIDLHESISDDPPRLHDTE